MCRACRRISFLMRGRNVKKSGSDCVILRARAVTLLSARSTSRAPFPVDRILRVDHAGERGVVRVYAGQRAVLQGRGPSPLVEAALRMQEGHKAVFEELLVKHRVRPSLLGPLWEACGFAMGAGSALLGRRAAEACAMALEASLVELYTQQLRVLVRQEGRSRAVEAVRGVRDGELSLHEAGERAGAHRVPGYEALSGAVRLLTRMGVALSERL